MSSVSSEGRFSSGLPSVTKASVHLVRGHGVQAPGIGSTALALDAEPSTATFGRTVFNTERPLGVAPVSEGQYISRQAASKVD